MADEETTSGSPRYVDETVEADENLRPNKDETEDRGTDKEPEVDEE